MTVTLTATFQDGAGTPCSGRVVFRLAEVNTDGTVIYTDHPISEILDANGALSVALTPTDAMSTTSSYEVTERLNGSPVRQYFVQLDSTPASQDLASLRAYTTAPTPTGRPSNHGDLNGLAGDDHTAYHTDARGDARYPRQTSIRARPHDMRLAAGAKMITAMQSGHGYTVGNAASSNANDTADYVIGTQSMKGVSAGTAAFMAFNNQTTVGTVDMTGRHFAVLIKVDDTTHLSQVYLYAFTGANYHQFALQLSVPTNTKGEYIQSGEWVWASIPWVPNATSGSVTRSAIDGLRVTFVDDNTGNPITAHVQAIASVPNASTAWPNGVVSVCFDDCYIEQWNYGRPQLDKYGFPATVFAIQDNVETPGVTWMSLAQLKQARDYSGWEIAGHASTLANHNARFWSLSAADLDAELRAQKLWLDANGFNPDLTALPGGEYDTATLTAMRGYFTANRNVNQRTLETLPVTPRAKLRGYGVQASMSTASLQTQVDNAYANGAWLILVFHKIVTSGATGNEYTQANFNTVVDYLNTKGIPVRTVGDVLASMT